MNAIENIFLNSGFSWTLSKLLPYIIAIIFGIILMRVFRKKLKKSRKFISLTLKFMLFILPFMLYFFYSPIYQGDFSNNSVTVKKEAKYDELTGKKLVVISMPGCPYCYQAIDRLKKLKERVPSAEIEYVLCAYSDSTLTEPLKWYKEKGGDVITVRYAKDNKSLSQLADNKFPTFILVDKNKDLKKWSNDSFGVAAMDEIELLLN